MYLMDKWFTVEKIDDVTYAISEYGHWEEPHAYLIVGTKKAVLVDTGLGVEDIKAEVEKITKLPVCVIITHSHWDHIGGVNLFSQVLVHSEDADWLENGLPISDAHVRSNFSLKPTSIPLPDNFKLSDYHVPRVKPGNILHDGNLIDLGGRELKIIHTPGHSPGSICIIEEKNGYLFSGDTLYEGTLYMNYESTDPSAFANSIERLSKLREIKKILPGHHKLPLDRDFLLRVNESFEVLREKQALHHGSGLHEFGSHKILI